MTRARLNVVCYADGLAEPTNPGLGSWGFVITDGQGRVLTRGRGFGGYRVSNNAMEYTAATRCVQKANSLYPKHAKVLRSDSQLVIRQATGEYAVRSPNILPYYEDLMRVLDATWSLEWVPREQNELADHESREGFWETVRKWPERGRLLDHRPDERRRPVKHPAQATLEGELKWL